MPLKRKEKCVSAARGEGGIVNHCAVVNLLCVVNLLRRSIFSTAGSFGIGKQPGLKVQEVKIQRFYWGHANGGIINGGVACVCAKWRVFVNCCAFLHFFVRFCAFFPTKMGCKKAPLVIPPFACHRF